MPDGLVTAVRNRIADFDQNYSRFREDSLISEMSRAPGNYLLPDDAEPLFDIYRYLYIHTKGAVTPLIGQVLVDAGYDAQYSLKPKALRKPPTWDEALSYNYPNLKVRLPVLLDVGAAGKGYLVDIVADIVASFGVKAFVVDAGGDMVTRGDEIIQVGLEHPDQTDEAVGVVQLHNQALCGSAGNRRKWASFTHIIDPSSLKSPEHIKAVWVTANSTLVADAMTTALFFTDAKMLQRQHKFEYAIIKSDLSLESSQAFPAEFFK